MVRNLSRRKRRLLYKCMNHNCDCYFYKTSNDKKRFCCKTCYEEYFKEDFKKYIKQWSQDTRYMRRSLGLYTQGPRPEEFK